MKQKFSFRSLVMAFITIGLVVTTFTSCDNKEDEINALKKDVEKLTASFDSLKKTVDSGNYVKGVTATDTGILVTFKDDTTSEVPVDGKAPVITVDEATGDLLVDGKVVGNVKGPKGDKGEPGDTGATGPAGPAGPAGTAADAPKITVEDGELKVNGESLDPKVMIPEASNNAYVVETEGKVELHVWNKEKGEYQSVSLAKATVGLTSLVYFPEAYINGVEAIVFRPLIFRSFIANVVTEDSCNPVTPGETPCINKIGNTVVLPFTPTQNFNVQMLSLPIEVAYNMNASNIDMSKIDVENLDVTSHIAKMYKNRGGAEDAVDGNPYTAKFSKIENGKLYVNLDIDYAKFAEVYGNKIPVAPYVLGWIADGYEDTDGVDNIVLALQVPNKDENAEKPYITSDYAVAVVKPLAGIDIAKKEGDCLRYSDMIDPAGGGVNVPEADVDWAGVDNAKEMGDGINLYQGDTVTKTKDARIVDLVEGETLDLHTVVKAIDGSAEFGVTNPCTTIDIERFGFEWKFDLLDGAGNEIVYKLTANATDQQKFITLDEATGVVKARVYDEEPNGAAVDRTPIVRVRIVDPKNPDCFVSQAFIKILIGKKPETPHKPMTIGLPQKEFEIACGKEGYHVDGLTTEEVNELIYNEVGMSKKDFHKKYTSFVQVPVDGVSLGTVWLKTDTGDGQTTYLPQWKVSVCDLYARMKDKCGEDVNVATLTAKGKYVSTSGEEIEVVFSVKVTKSNVGMEITKADMIQAYWDDDYTFVKHHTQVPTVNDEVNVYLPIGGEQVNEFDINNPFAPGGEDILGYKNDLNVSFDNVGVTPTKFVGKTYTYVFSEVDKQFKDATDVNGDKFKLTVVHIGGTNPDGVVVTHEELWAEGTVPVATFTSTTTISGTVTTTIWNNELKSQKVAEIRAHTSTGADFLDAADPTDAIEIAKRQDNLVYIHNEVADYLLNKTKSYMWANIRIKSACTCPEADSEYVKINGKDEFTVHFLRPLSVEGKTDGKFVDSADETSDDTFVLLEGLLKYTDWRGIKFPEAGQPVDYVDFYGVEENELEFNREDVTWNATGSFDQMPSTVELSKVQRADGKWYLHYHNTGTAVDNVIMKIPVTVKYSRGVIGDAVIEIKVSKTLGQ